jgi:hypothetical protein
MLASRLNVSSASRPFTASEKRRVLALGEDDEEFEVDGVVVDEKDAGAEVFAAFGAGAQGSDCRGEGLIDGR